MPQIRQQAPRAVVTAATLTALVLGSAACGSPVTAPGAGAPGVVAPTASSAPPAEPYGACDQVPMADMADRPVVSALSESPQLTALSAALGRLPGLSDTLNAEQAVTFFAPTDAAFAEAERSMGKSEFAALLADPEQLDGLISYHVAPRAYDAGQLVEAGKTTQLAYGDVTVGGTPEALTLTSTGGAAAGVVCGNVRTANATVFVIDEVLTPAT